MTEHDKNLRLDILQRALEYTFTPIPTVDEQTTSRPTPDEIVKTAETFLNFVNDSKQ